MSPDLIGTLPGILSSGSVETRSLYAQEATTFSSLNALGFRMRDWSDQGQCRLRLGLAPTGAKTGRYRRARPLPLSHSFHVRRFAADVDRVVVTQCLWVAVVFAPVGASRNAARIGGNCYNARDCTRAAVGLVPTGAGLAAT